MGILWLWIKRLFSFVLFVLAIIGMGGVGEDVQGWAAIIAAVAPYLDTAWVRIFSGCLFAGLFAKYAPVMETWLQDKLAGLRSFLFSIRYKFPGNKRKLTRLYLARLRTRGVVLRNEINQVLPFQPGGILGNPVESWFGKLDTWRELVINGIELLDSADAEWFRTLDAVPSPRVSCPSDDPKITKAFREHDYRLKRLEDLIQKYGNA